MSLQVVILCGGKGSRSGLPINKCFVDVNGKPFILHQLELLEDQEIYDVTLARGTTGTLAALRRLAPYLDTWFIVLYGDTYLPLDLRHFDLEWAKSGLDCATAFYDGVDAGVNGIARYALDDLPDETDFGKLRDHWDAQDKLFHYPAPERWLEVGSPEGIRETRDLLK